MRLLLFAILGLLFGCDQQQSDSIAGAKISPEPMSSTQAGSAAFERGDYREAAKQFRISAGDESIRGGAAQVHSTSNLGRMYLEGKGVPQDYVEAAKWIRIAAEQNLDIAQFNLAEMYKEGRGVPKDYVQAHKWANLAATTSSNTIRVLATSLRISISNEMSAVKIAEAQRLAGEWKRKCWDGSVAPEGVMC